MAFEPALNVATAGAGLSVPDYIALAARHNYSWIEFNGSQVPELVGLGAAARESLAEQGLAVASFFLPVNWREDDERFRGDAQAFGRMLPALASLGATRTCTYLFPNLPAPPAESRRMVGTRFREVARMLHEHGMGFGLEFLGPAHFLAEPGHTFLRRMEDMLDFAAGIGPNVGILVDSLHWHCLGADAEALAAVPTERLVYAHVNDASDVPVETQRDDDRLLPGEGVIDLASFFDALDRAKYSGPVGIEVDGPRLAGLPPDDAASAAMAAWTSLLPAADAGAGEMQRERSRHAR